MPDPRPESPPVLHQRLDVRRRHEGLRLDQFLAEAFTDFSRSQLQRLIRSGAARLNGQIVRPAHPLRAGDRVEVTVEVTDSPALAAEDIPLDVLLEDDHILAVNKPSDLLVHPTRTGQSGTLVNALLAHCPTLSSGYGDLRPGIVHRLDRNTSGVIVVAKTDAAHAALAEQFKARTVEKHYLAVVEGSPELDGDLIDAPIGMHRKRPELMAVRTGSSKPAQTIYRVVRRYVDFARLDVQILTGRTHQIRVHLAHLGHPIVGDASYGGLPVLHRSDLLGQVPAEGEPPLIARQALHARRIAFTHPATGDRLEVAAPIPPDILALLAALDQLQSKS